MKTFHFKLPVLTLFFKNIYSKSSDFNICFILIFTCALSRYNYLELSPDKASVSFIINCFKRFISCWGTPTKVVRDNFRSFKSSKTKFYLKEINVTWKPILETSHDNHWVVSTKDS